jgi:hypothetical protein
MSDTNDFNDARDDALGTLLREHLSADDDAAFAARMRLEAMAAAQASDWSAVAHWALPALAAAALLLAAMGAAFGRVMPESMAHTASGSTAGSLTELASDSTQAGGGALLAVMSY